MSRPAKPAPINYAFYPHIVETILSYCDYATLLRFRATCQPLKFQAHRMLLNGCLYIEVQGSFIDRWSLSPEYEFDNQSYPPGEAPQTPTVVMRSGTAVLPFRTEADWTWACAHSDAVEIDSAALAAHACIASHRTKGVVVRKYGSRRFSGDFPSRPVPSTPDSVDMQASLIRALEHIPRSAVATIDHTGREGLQGTPAYLPATDTLVFLLSDRCDCMLFEISVGRYGFKRSPPPALSAKHVVLCVSYGQYESDAESDSSDSNYATDTCELSFAFLDSSIEHLTVSVDQDIDALLLDGYLSLLTGLLVGTGKSVRKVDLELRLHRWCPYDDDEKKVALKMAWASLFSFDAKKVHLMYSDTAGLRGKW